MSEHNCPLGGRCCQGEGEVFWLNDPQKLFCSYSPIPHGNLASGERLNSLTRFVIYLSILMLCSGYTHARAFFILGIMFIILIYITSTKSEKEGYAVVNEIDVQGNFNQRQMNGIPISKNYSQNLQLPNVNMNMLKQVDEALIPVYEPNENNFMGSSEEYLKATSFDNEGGSRDIEADIQYYGVKSGVNRRAMINPVIAPRIFDQEVFGKRSTQISNTHSQNMIDLTDDLDLGNNHGLIMDDPYSLGNPYKFQKRVPNGVTMMNRIGDTGNKFTGLQDDGSYPGGQFMDRSPDSRDFYKNVPHLNPDENPESIKAASDAYQSSQFQTTKNAPDNIVSVDKKDQVPRKGVKEGFDFVNLNEGEVVKDNFGGFEAGNAINASYNRFNRAQPNTSVVNDQLLQESPSYIYNNSYFDQPDRRMYLQDIQPKMYSYSMNQEPINSNLGISMNYQPAPRFLDQVNNNGMGMPIYSRIDPQLVRSDGTKGQINAQPLRTEWSANYSQYIPPEGSIDFEDIYDPRFNSYGDGTRAYSDINQGQVHYYYSDVDAYRQPNFITRSNVEFTEYRTPQNQVWPEYNRTASLDDMRSKVASQYDADDMFHRQDMMEHQMSKMNRENWQQRFAPLRKTNNSSIGPN
jgi:hypothetical protein